MKFSKITRYLSSFEQTPVFIYLFKWFLICSLLAILAGSVSAFFLVALEWATNYRESNVWIIGLLPLAGLAIGLSYHYWGSGVVKGNNLLLEEFHSPKKIIPFRMVPLVLFGTIITHLFGGSAGREGTAVQMGGAIADRITKSLNFKNRDRKILLIAGISAGFAAVFGTPLAGAVFALEVMILGRIRLDALVPSFLAAVLADYVVRFWEVPHIHYEIANIPSMNLLNLVLVLLAGILFGITARIFSKATHFWQELFQNKIKYPPLRPVIGGVIIALAVLSLGTTKYIGLGIPVILDSFGTQLPTYDFILKILFTSFTLGAGFKGGEVTPLFFIGATLGNALFWIIPLPMGLLAGMGFVAVFAGATNTPIACTIMGIELFGIEGGVFIGLACVTAYLFSGHTGIYSSQIIGSPKNLFYGKDKGKPLSQIRNKSERKDTVKPPK